MDSFTRRVSPSMTEPQRFSIAALPVVIVVNANRPFMAYRPRNRTVSEW